MKLYKRYIIFGLSATILQILLSDLLSIKLIRPDFILIFLLYLTIWEGRIAGIITGFLLGLLVDFVGVASYFGLSALLYTGFTYILGVIYNKYSKWPPILYHSFWSLSVVLLYFIRFSITSARLLDYNPQVFWGNVLFSSLYTLAFAIIVLLFLPLTRDN